VERLLLRRRRRDLEQAAFAQPDIDASSGGKGAYGGNDLARGAAQAQRSVVSEQLAQARERRPVAVEEAAVPPARPAAADALLEHRDAQGRVALEQGESGPEPGVAAADDRDVDVDVASERRCL